MWTASCNNLQDGFRQILWCLNSKHGVIQCLYNHELPRSNCIYSQQRHISIWHLQGIFCIRLLHLMFYCIIYKGHHYIFSNSLYIAQIFLSLSFLSLSLCLHEAFKNLVIFSATFGGIYHIKKETWACGYWSLNRDIVRELKLSISRSLTSEKPHRLGKRLCVFVDVCLCIHICIYLVYICTYIKNSNTFFRFDVTKIVSVCKSKHLCICKNLMSDSTLLWPCHTCSS